MKINKSLIIILLIASALRLINLGNNPPHLAPDEAALGYNAYSILKTARDEHGQLLPIVFKSFGDYKPGFYIYTAVPSVALFGLTEFATRLPSAMAGIAAVFLLYLIIKKLSSNNSLALTSSFLLAFSPWHIHFSRGAWEINLALTLTLAGVYFFLLSLKNQKYLVTSSIFFALTIITYQGAKLSTLIIILILTIIYRKKCFKFNPKIISTSVIAGLIIVSPIIISIFQGKAGRLAVFSVFSYPRTEEYIQNFISEADISKNSLLYNLFYSEPLNFTRGIMGRWFNHYSGRFLFFEGDWQNPRHSLPNHGMLALYDLPLLLIGLYALTQTKHKKLVSLTILWLIFAPIPSALSRDQVHAVRSFHLVIPLTIISALGLTYIFDFLRKSKSYIQYTIYVIQIAVLAASFSYFLDAYFVHQPNHNSKLWEYGYKQIVNTITPIQNNFETIKVQQSFAQPYIYFLFYQKYDPKKYQSQNSYINSEYKFDVGYVEKLDNIKFVPIDWSVNRGDKNTLIVADPIRIPLEDLNFDEHTIIKSINHLSGDPAFNIIKIK